MKMVLAAKPVLLAIGVGAMLWSSASIAASSAETFASPEKAVDAFIAASRNNDSAGLVRIFGSAARDLVSSGDAVADRDVRAQFVTRYGEAEKILYDSPKKATLVIGADAWPFPIPLVKQGGAWHFDAAAGAQEILNRRIGRNEMSAMEVCRNYVMAQREYAADLQNKKLPVEYAQKMFSSPGSHDGLYWPAGPGEVESPMGPAMAHARAEGYDPGGTEQRAPYHGYFYKILTRQGAAASGGARDYVVGGHLTEGFALVAFPAKYGDSGVMTFVINEAGIVFEKDLGPNTATIAPAIAEYNPDMTWKTR